MPGGYRVTGRWAFASGCAHADCMVASCVVLEGGQPRLGPDGTPRVHACILPPGACEILDTWYTAGMRGTGSQDFRAQDVFVPERHCWPAGARAHDPGPLYTTLLYTLWGPNIAAVALGIARAALEAFLEVAASKRSRRHPSVLAQRELVQVQVGEAEALVRSGRAFLYESVRQGWASLTTRGSLPEDQAACCRLAAATAVRHAVQAVDSMFTAAGSASIYARNRLERCFRDVHMVPQHAVVGPAVFGLAGRSFLGLGLGR